MSTLNPEEGVSSRKWMDVNIKNYEMFFFLQSDRVENVTVWDKV